FVDEIHRFNKAQQDAFLPYLEDGTLTLVGATTENPSFHLNDALLSRMRVLTLKSLDVPALDRLVARYEKLRKPLPLDEKAREQILHMAHGDGRYLLNLVENLAHLSADAPVTVEGLEGLLQERPALLDRSGDQHYNLISALHNSVRGSDPDAALYWLARMLEGGEDPLFIARRMIRMATEDIGLADPQALTQAIAARDSFEMLGSPEGELALAQCVVYLALAPKSNAIYSAFKEAQVAAKSSGHCAPPKTILNAPTKLMKAEGYGKDYAYDHNTEHGFSGQNYFPDGMARPIFYRPVQRGFEREMQKRITYFNELRSSSFLDFETPHPAQ
ncbi:MAG: replication-associated recombination protein A, partial [Chlamydiia bacterium]|nr:replication-associated recombination protein A [Chlamydiia bacterium]